MLISKKNEKEKESNDAWVCWNIYSHIGLFTSVALLSFPSRITHAGTINGMTFTVFTITHLLTKLSITVIIAFYENKIEVS